MNKPSLSAERDATHKRTPGHGRPGPLSQRDLGFPLLHGYGSRLMPSARAERSRLGVLLQAQPLFVVLPVLIGSLLLTAMAVRFSRLHGLSEPDPEYWL